MTTGMEQLMADVRAFHEKCGVTLNSSGIPGFPGADRMALARRLVRDEYGELQDAWFGDCDDDLPDFADAIADMIYVLVRAALVCGIPLDRVWDEVQRANMAKAGGPIREDGKVLKPPGWQPPDIHKAIWGSDE